jgi:hypothetical protein
LSLKEIHVDKNAFPINPIDLQNSMLSICLEQAEMIVGKNMIIKGKRVVTADEKILSHEVVLEKFVDANQGSHAWGGGADLRL